MLLRDKPPSYFPPGPEIPQRGRDPVEQARQNFAQFVNANGGRLITALEGDSTAVIGDQRTLFQVWPDDSGEQRPFLIHEVITREATRAEWEACHWPTQNCNPGSRFVEVSFD